MKIQILRRLEEKSKADADELRSLRESHGICSINIMGAPGCGKTTLLEHLLPELQKRFRCAVLEGDLYTARDAERIAVICSLVIQLETQGACHLDAGLVHRGFRELPLDDLDYVFIENVGNIICPANFDLGETARLVLMSVTEGHDKPAKYPLLFARADAVVITKTDLLGLTDFDVGAATAEIQKFNGWAPLFTFDIRSGISSDLGDWVARLRQ